ERRRRLARHAARNDIRKAKGVGELIGADAGAVAEFFIAARAPEDVVFFGIEYGLAVVVTAAEFGHVAEVRHVRPVVAQDGAFVRVDFGKGEGAEAGGFKAEANPPDTTEQVKMRGRVVHPKDGRIVRG